MLVLHDVSRSYGEKEGRVEALQNVSLELRSATMTAVMGPSGSGKSTLLSVAGGLLPPSTGFVTVAGTRLDALNTTDFYAHRRQHVGFVFQGYNLVDMLDSEENVSLPLELDGVPRRKARGMAREALDRVGMSELHKRMPHTLSGGQKQRVAIARAVVGERRLVLADEPTGALDSDNAALILDVLVSLVRDGVSCLVVTHDRTVADRATAVVQMVDGHLSRASAFESSS